MFEVDRVAAVIKPTKVMHQWISTNITKYENVTLKQMQSDCVVLMIPAFDGPKQAISYIKQIYGSIFEAELISWGASKDQWPTSRSFELFQQWFSIDFHSKIFDIAYAEETQGR
jgi:hypothetical protein